MDELKGDVIVAGGGLAGCLSAVAIRRTAPGVKVMLLERYGFLGGMATAGYVFPFMRYWTHVAGQVEPKRLVGGLFNETCDRMASAGYMADKNKRHGLYQRFDPVMLRCILDEMLLEAGVQVFLHGIVNHVETREGGGGATKVDAVHVQFKAGTIRVSGDWFVDATGDADLAYHAGGRCLVGRESDGLVQPATLNFRMGNIGVAAAPRSIIGAKIKEAKARGNPLTPRDDCLKFSAGRREQHFNQTRVAGFDFTDPAQRTEAEIEGRAQARRFIDFLRAKIRGYRGSTVVGMGVELGVRESRRVVGHHLLHEDELLSGHQFDDRVALGNYPIDIHDPKGSASTELRRLPRGEWYSIPLRSLIPKDLNNVVVAGRPISSTHVAHSAIRVMPTCAAIGHAAGVAISKAIETNDAPLNVVGAIQDQLRQQGAVLE